MNKNALSTIMVAIVLTLIISCKKDRVEMPVVDQKQQSVMQWGQTVNSRWIPYLLRKAKKEYPNLNAKGITKVFASYIEVLNVSKDQYQEKLYLDPHSDSKTLNLSKLYTDNYQMINDKMGQEGVMDSLWLSYKSKIKKIEKNGRSAGKRIMSSGDPGGVEILGCSLTEIFVAYAINWRDLPDVDELGLATVLTMSDPEQNDCQEAYLAQMGLFLWVMWNSGSQDEMDCQRHYGNIEIAVNQYLECDDDDDWGVPPDPFPPGGGGGSGGGGDPEEPGYPSTPTFSYENWRNSFYNKIDTSSMSPCFKTALRNVKALHSDMAKVVNSFDATIPSFPGHNWRVIHGTLASSQNGVTTNYDNVNSRVNTTIDVAKFAQASDLAVMRTLMHEAAHAYLVSYFKNDPLNANKEFKDLVEAWNNKKSGQTLNQIHHDQFVNSFIQPIYFALREYGDTKGYTFANQNEKNQYYHDLAWGGLTDTNAFNSLSTSIKNRIKDTIATEQFGTDRNGVNPRTKKGGNSGC